MISCHAHGAPGRACALRLGLLRGYAASYAVGRLTYPVSTVGMVQREPVGPPEGFPRQDLLVVDALERAGGAPNCFHRDHQILFCYGRSAFIGGEARHRSRSCVPCLLPPLAG
jgi:hypothetical protein